MIERIRGVRRKLSAFSKPISSEVGQTHRNVYVLIAAAASAAAEYFQLSESMFCGARHVNCCLNSFGARLRRPAGSSARRFSSVEATASAEHSISGIGIGRCSTLDAKQRNKSSVSELIAKQKR